jgi:hypothetical protein
MDAAVAPGAAANFPAVEKTAVNAEIRKSQVQRRLAKRQQMQRDPAIAKDSRVMRDRVRQRQAAQELHAENRRVLEPQRASDLQSLRSWFSAGYLNMQLVENIPPGWLILAEAGLGKAMSPQQLEAYKELAVSANVLGVPMATLPPWHATGIMHYGHVMGVLNRVGFDIFVNFFGDAQRRVWAIEVPLAKTLNIFVAGWVQPVAVTDRDWAVGGEGPYLAIRPDTDDGFGVSAVNPSVQAAETVRQQSYADYLQARMAQPGTYEADQPLQLPRPTEAEKGAGAMPPSVAAGNPGLEPIPEEGKWPPPARLNYWAKEILKVAIIITAAQGHYGQTMGAIKIAAPLDSVLKDVLSRLAGEYFAGEDDRITQLRIRLNSFYTNLLAEKPDTIDIIDIDEVLFAKVEERVAAKDFPFVRNLAQFAVPAAPSSVTQPPSGWSGGEGRGQPSDPSGEASRASEWLWPSSSPAPGGLVQEPEVPDPLPPSGQSLQEQQIMVVQSAALQPKPPEEAYNSIIDFRQSAVYKKGSQQVDLGLVRDFKGAHAVLVPTLRQRRNYFYVRTDWHHFDNPLGRFYSDGTNTVDDPAYCAGRKLYRMNTLFVRAGEFRTEADNILGLSIPAGIAYQWGVPADSPQSLGLFGHEQMSHLYRKLAVYGQVMFSVNQGKAIQFFPQDYCCANVWWWQSKLNFLPSSLRFHQVASGGFNKAFRLVRTTGDELPDHFLFLPPTRLAYDMSITETDEAVFAATKQNGIIYRLSYSSGKEDKFGIQKPLRELMIAGYAASVGVGPVIFAAYVVPGPGGRCEPPQMRMNTGDEDELLANPIYRPPVQPEQDRYLPGSKPWAPWFNGDAPWRKIHTEQYDGGWFKTGPHPGWVNDSTKTAGYQRMVVVMESYTGDMASIRLRNREQKKMLVDKLFELFENMGRAGILHCDMKPLNVVQRTWHDGSDTVDADTTYGGQPWTELELRAIDFDPYFVKLVPWLPWEVIALINAAEYLAYMRCFGGNSSLYDSMLDFAVPKLRELHEACNRLYPSGIAAAFRALKPDYDRTGPPEIDGKPNERYRVGSDPPEIYNMFSDEFEAAGAFRYWIVMYLERRCFEYDGDAPREAGMLARLLSFVRYGTISSAEPGPAGARGNFPLDTPRATPLDTPLDASAEGIWGDRTRLGHVGPAELERDEGDEGDE